MPVKPDDRFEQKGFDPEGFYNALAATVRARDLTWKQVSKETGVSATTLTRMGQGRKPDAASLAVLSAWAALNPADFVKDSVRAKNPESMAAISTLLRRDPRLEPDAASALEAIIRTAYNQLKKN